jgi:hypothetical protein
MIESIILAGALLSGPATAGTAAVAIRAAEVPARWQPFAACVARRESNDNPRSVNRSSGAAGRWQFLPAWRHGLPYMVAARLREHGLPRSASKALRLRLQATPIQRWEPVLQDVGFAAALMAPNGQGWRHWSLPGSKCQGLVPR